MDVVQVCGKDPRHFVIVVHLRAEAQSPQLGNAGKRWRGLAGSAFSRTIPASFESVETYAEDHNDYAGYVSSTTDAEALLRMNRV